MYFSAEQVSTSFKRLASRKNGGKTPMERTSALMYFLAFDAVSKAKGVSPLEFDPDKTEGRINRKAIELEFTKLVLLNKSPGQIVQVSELGKIDHEGKDPEKRISSNFLTVPLKRASEYTTPYSYPKRPATPLMKLGNAATGLKWGIDYFDDWSSNLLILLLDIKQSTPFTDLAVFIFRDSYFEEYTEYVSALSSLVDNRFSKNLSCFWISKLEQERLFARHMHLPSSSNHDPFGKEQIRSGTTQNSNHDQLVKHIVYLENLLSTNEIDFKPL